MLQGSACPPAPFWSRGAAPTTPVAARSVSATAAVGWPGPGIVWTHLSEAEQLVARAWDVPHEKIIINIMKMSSMTGSTACVQHSNVFIFEP